MIRIGERVGERGGGIVLAAAIEFFARACAVDPAQMTQARQGEKQQRRERKTAGDSPGGWRGEPHARPGQRRKTDQQRQRGGEQDDEAFDEQDKLGESGEQAKPRPGGAQLFTHAVSAAGAF